MTNAHAKLLLIEDTPSLQLVYKAVLSNAGHKVDAVSDGRTGTAAFRAQRHPLVVLDLMLPDADGLDLMREMLTLEPETRVVVVTANGSINKAVEAMRLGAYDFLVKPFDESRFLLTVENALQDHAEAQPDMPDAVIDPAKVPPGEFIGTSRVMAEVYSRVRSVSRSMATVIITGESGTGKEVCAQAIHDESNRADKPFVPLNCGAIPPDLLESEVFGHLKGSFTGAIQDKPGAAAAADGGTLFLDEICEMDLNLQTKLLRFLQTSTIQPVGATVPRKVNVRIICATNRDPLSEVRRGRFREDLYFRLQVVPINMPPLRDRGDDVMLIAQEALQRLSREEGKVFTGLSPEVERVFRELPWPGNVRQLLNVLRNIVVLNRGPQVTMSMLPIEILNISEKPGSIAPKFEDAGQPSQDESIGFGGLIGRTMAEIERLVIEETIAQHGGSVPKAARVLDLSPSTIYRKREAWLRGEIKVAQ